MECKMVQLNENNHMSDNKCEVLQIPHNIGDDMKIPIKKPGLVNKMRKVPCLGIFFALLYAFFMSTSVTFVKLAPGLNPIAILLYRSMVQTVVFAFLALYNDRKVFGAPNERIFLAGRAISGAMNQGAWYISVRKISLTDSSSVYYSAPVFVCIFAYFLLNEPFGVFEFTSVAATVTGVLLISKPSFLPIFGDEKENSFKGEHMEGLLYALAGAILFAGSNIFIRKLQKTSTEITSTWFSMACSLLSLLYCIYLDDLRLPEGWLEWTVIITSGAFGTLGNIAFVLALKIEKAGPVAVAQTFNIVIVLIYQVLFFGESVSPNTLIGAFMIASSVALIGLKDIISEAHLVKNLKNYATNTVSYQLDCKSNVCKKSSIEKVSVYSNTTTDGKYIPFNNKNCF
ncbi:solute carrier family 35 member G1-like [Brevipalpus obovatus]|uniref:solute carrier family 35 member G1-like n=1 Tax=Brevipalpus obovatus TaxID=246614 RepID=UPI003D9E62E5